ncbi:hypothetical protein HK100_012173 [Physocladia obscura]|uniref:Uncharacterized protein n=1 Tax=Physocladia obscura TaxID=109957 RepID=A0AAD5XHS9_9FUNG|nr:hypothetical protein HK100_012173 [Physocladia obscura]
MNVGDTLQLVINVAGAVLNTLVLMVLMVHYKRLLWGSSTRLNRRVGWLVLASVVYGGFIPSDSHSYGFYAVMTLLALDVVVTPSLILYFKPDIREKAFFWIN